MIKSKKLTKIKNLKHGFFNRTGGKSKKIYKSLNCGPGSKDLLSNVKKNLKSKILQDISQTHFNTVQEALYAAFWPARNALQLLKFL